MDITVETTEIGTDFVTLPANEITTVTFDGYLTGVEVITDGASPLWWTGDGSDPTPGHGWFIPAQGVDERRIAPTSSHTDGVTDLTTTIKIWSNGTPAVRVQRAG